MSAATTDHVGEKSSKTALTIRRIIAYVVLVLLTIISLFPFVIMIINSTRSHPDIQKGFKFVIGKSFGTNFSAVFRNTDIPLLYGLRNSLIVAGCCALLSTYFSALTAYGIHVYEFRLKKFAFAFILVIMMVPAQVSALGFYRMMFDLGLTNNLLPLIIPSIAAPATFFFMKQYMDSSLPLEIVEAARIDGCGEFRTFLTIALPMMKPAIAVQAIFAFVANWNNYYTQNMILKNEKLATVPIMVSKVLGFDKNIDNGVNFLCVTLSILPIVIVYFILSKFIIAGVALGGVKE